MKLLITGGAGYVGSVLTNIALQSGISVRAVDILWFENTIPSIHFNNPGYEFIKADITDYKLHKNYLKDVDFVVHTAAVVGEPASNKFPDLTRKINEEASKRLINVAAEEGIKGFIFLSTCSNYGIAEGLATEASPINPLSLYAETKVNVEQYLMENVKNLDWVICRLSTIYGSSPRMRFDLTVNDFAMNAFQKKYLDIFLPYTYRPYIHVYDAANVIINIVTNFNRVKNNVFNIGFNGENYQKIRIAEIIQKFIPELKIEVVNKGTDLRDYQVDFSKLLQYLGMKNYFTVEGGVKEILELIKNGIIKNPSEDKYYNTKPSMGA